MSITEDNSMSLNMLDEKGVYKAFNVDGNEADALTDSYFELYQLLGAEAMLKLYKYYSPESIVCSLYLYSASSV